MDDPLTSLSYTQAPEESDLGRGLNKYVMYVHFGHPMSARCILYGTLCKRTLSDP